MMLLFISLVFLAFAALAEVECYDAFTTSNLLFSQRLYKAINNDVVSNQLISPLSLNYALTALSFGTAGDSLGQLWQTLDLIESLDDDGQFGTNSEADILSSYRAFTNSLKNNNNLTLATKLFIGDYFPVKSEYLDVLRNNFDAGVETLDFVGDPDGSTDIINSFVDEKTNHLIPYLFDKGTITSDTESVLVNAVYFKSQWRYPFSQDNTKMLPFYGLHKQYIVNMMNQEEYFQHREDLELNAQLLELPYLGDFSFLVILPRDRNGITELENKLFGSLDIHGNDEQNSVPFLDIFEGTSREYVNVSLPKFTFEQTHDLNEILQKMGVEDIFSAVHANFEQLTDDMIYVDKVVQKTFIKVNENGTEAAAATGMNIVWYSYPPPPIQFNADHPFIYIIRHNLSGTPLFVGKFSHP